MNRPISMQIMQLRQKLTDAINESCLHPAVLEMVVDALHAQLQRIAQEQQLRERAQYEKQLQEQEPQAQEEG